VDAAMLAQRQNIAGMVGRITVVLGLLEGRIERSTALVTQPPAKVARRAAHARPR
jgi:hypothetical protein